MPAPGPFASFVAIGDSFTEGMGDLGPDGVERGWADLVAVAMARAAGSPIPYANLAIRGRKLGPLVDEQLQPAIAMAPALLSINGGGNDILRPRMPVATVADRLVGAAERALDAGVPVLLLSGGDPSGHLPLGGVFRRRGLDLMHAVQDRAAGLSASASGGAALYFCDNFTDETLREDGYWAEDGLHLNTRGHHRVAANVLGALAIPVPEDYLAVAATPLRDTDYRSAAYWRAHVAPWVGRRLRGRSSGDGRRAKRPELSPIGP